MRWPQAAPDSVQQVLDSVFSGADYQWVVRPESWLTAAWRDLGAWLDALRVGNPVLFQLMELGLLAVLAAIVVHAGWVVLRTIRLAAVSEESGLAAVAAPRHDAAWHAARADDLAGQGRYLEALQAAYLALVLQLDAAGWLRYHPSKTPGEYLREARLAEADRRRLTELVGRLYRAAYGGEPCDAESYRQWRDQAAGAWHAALA